MRIAVINQGYFIDEQQLLLGLSRAFQRARSFENYELYRVSPQGRAVNIIENPSESALRQLQDILASERPGGIVDIWVNFSPFYLAAEHDGSIIGVASLSVHDTAAEIYKLYVAPSHRRSGVAGKLFHGAIHRMRRSGKAEVHIEVTSEAGRSFFEALNLEYNVQEIDQGKYVIQLDG
jgi:ribosomal protein S18 acetylase RimI-like enzyme